MVGQCPQFEADSHYSPISIPRYFNNCILQGSSQSKQEEEFSVIVYNYFLDGFPKSYSLSPNDTLYDLTTLILNDNKQLKREGIKKFIDQLGRQVSDCYPIAQVYPSQYKLQMEIIFNENIKITNNNKQIEFFMLKQSKSSRNDIFNAISVFSASEKGGKIIVGVNQDGLIKGETIPDQDRFKGDFEADLRRYLVSTQNSYQVLNSIEISFFRVKGQSKLSYKYQDHKKIMIIKIKGINQQAIQSNRHVLLSETHNIHINHQQNNSPDSVWTNSLTINNSKKQQRKPLKYRASTPTNNSSASTDTSNQSNSSEEDNATSQKQSDYTAIKQADNQVINQSFDTKQYFKNGTFCTQMGEDAANNLNNWNIALFYSLLPSDVEKEQS